MKKKIIITVLLIISTMLISTGCSGDLNDSKVEPAVQEQIETEAERSVPLLPEEQVRKLAFGAVLASRNEMNYDNLFGEEDHFIDAVKEGLKSSWSVTDHGTAIETLDWLKTEGHRGSTESTFGFDELFNLMLQGQEAIDEVQIDLSGEQQACDEVSQILMADYQYTEEELANVKTLSAWDYDRLVTVARWSYGCGYISEDEAWGYIDYAVECGAQDYGSWREYFAGVLYGRAVWAADSGFSSGNKDIADSLIGHSDSIYDYVTFKK